MFGNLNRRTFLAGATAAAALPALAACGGDDTSATGNASNNGQGVELTYLFRGGADERKA